MYRSTAIVAGVIALGTCSPAAGQSSDGALTLSLQKALDTYLTTRTEPEHISAASLSISLNGAEKDINKDVETMFGCCVPEKEAHAKNKPSPPFLRFEWGEFHSPPMHLKSVSVKYTLFKPDGKPLRAIASLELAEIPNEVHKQNPTSGALDVRTTHTVIAGDSLASISYAEYGDPTRWRAIAITNALSDPIRLVEGSRLLLPTPEEATAVN